MKKIERNDPCPCGSGKKYKQCCLKQDEALASNKRVESNTLGSLLQTALNHYQSGRYAEAEALYQQVIQLNPCHPEALHLLGIIAYQTGRFEQALEFLKSALNANPNFAEALNTQGLVYQQLGQLEPAVLSYQNSLALKPDFFEAHNNIGNALKDQGDFDAAIQHYQQALLLQPELASAHSNLGLLFRLQNKLDRAVEHCNTAIALQPNFAEAHNNFAGVLHQQGKLPEAVTHYRTALALKPSFAEAHNNLGVTLQALGKVDEAAHHYQQALSINPHYVAAHANLGILSHEQDKLDAAIAHYRTALALNPHNAETHNNCGNAFKDQGVLDKAIECYRLAILLKPNYAEAHSNLLYALNFQPQLDRADLQTAAQQYDTLIGQPLRSIWQAHHNDKTPSRRLRIGYVSPDFRNHAVAYFAEPILSNHDKSQVEVFCYAEVILEDDVTRRFQTYADHWHSTVGLSDDAMAQLIREHQIDILIDLAGHTAKNRLPVFARKPAPIQMTYLGYLGTTGLSTMDYLIADHYVEPEGGTDTYYSERLLRLPNSLWCYRPSAGLPPVTPLPGLTRGYLTFGSINNFNKVDRTSLELWAELLIAVPHSRLVMLSVAEGAARQHLLQHFKEAGVSEQRLECHGKLSLTEFRQKVLEMDLTLDPVNVNGATTTCESLWMGVPVLSWVGNRLINRAGLSILSTVGLNDFAVNTREEYFHLAQHLAENLPLLAEIRLALREHLRSSPLVDEKGFTSHLETLYRDAWMKWCTT